MLMSIWRGGGDQQPSEVRAGRLSGAAGLRAGEPVRCVARAHRRDAGGLRARRGGHHFLNPRTQPRPGSLLSRIGRQDPLLLRGGGLRSERPSEAGQGPLDQQGRPCAARSRPGLRAVLAPAGARGAGGGAWARRAPPAAVDVHLQAAADRRRGWLPSGCELPDDGARQRRGPVVRARGRHDPERLPLCGTGWSQGARCAVASSATTSAARAAGPR
jgi:hypothetical protein